MTAAAPPLNLGVHRHTAAAVDLSVSLRITKLAFEFLRTRQLNQSSSTLIEVYVDGVAACVVVAEVSGRCRLTTRPRQVPTGVPPLDAGQLEDLPRPCRCQRLAKIDPSRVLGNSTGSLFRSRRQQATSR